MKIWALGAVVSATIAVVACGNGTTTTTSTTAAGGSSSSSGTTLHVAASSSTGSPGVTTGTGGSGGAAGACGSLKYTQVAACEAVVETNCCAELMNCDTGTACDSFLSCANTCQGTAATCDATCTTCVQGCETSQAQGFMDLQTLQSCYDQKCAAMQGCGTEICTSKVLVADAMCGACLSKTDANGGCCEEWTACAADQTCATCIGSTAAACATNTLLMAANACQDNAACGPLCANTICDTGLGYPSRPACNYCLGKKDANMGCCEEMEACKADATCLACITGMKSGATCTANMPYTKFNTCNTANCATACGG